MLHQQQTLLLVSKCSRVHQTCMILSILPYMAFSNAAGLIYSKIQPSAPAAACAARAPSMNGLSQCDRIQSQSMERLRLSAISCNTWSSRIKRRSATRPSAGGSSGRLQATATGRPTRAASRCARLALPPSLVPFTSIATGGICLPVPDQGTTHPQCKPHASIHDRNLGASKKKLYLGDQGTYGYC